MASVSAPGGRSAGEKKLLNVDLNLVPFIDLLTCLICFLLMAAVWTQLGKISIKPSGRSPAVTTPEVPLDSVDLVVSLSAQGILVHANGQLVNGGDILKNDSGHNYAKLGKTLSDIKGAFPDKNSVVVMSEDDVQYQDLINAFDVCLASNFPDISVSSTI